MIPPVTATIVAARHLPGPAKGILEASRNAFRRPSGPMFSDVLNCTYIYIFLAEFGSAGQLLAREPRDFESGLASLSCLLSFDRSCVVKLR
jgi:hypothetical protein